MFPDANANMYRNEAGEPIGWDYPPDDDFDYDPDDFLPDWEDDEPEWTEEDPEFPYGTTVRVDGYGGVAFYVRDVLDDQVHCVMVGDDRVWTFDRSDLTKIAREDFCGVCGALGCTHDGYDRENDPDEE